MHIILTQNVPNLGSLGDEVQVKDGYARNYLLPRGLALAASGKNARALEHQRTHLEQIRAGAIQQATGEAEKVAALELVVKVKAGTGGRLFGSVTNRDIQAQLAEKGYEIDRKSITLNSLVKSLGTFTAQVKLHTDVKVDITFRVLAEGELVQPEPTEAPEDGEAAEVGAEQIIKEATATETAATDASADVAAEASPEAGEAAAEQPEEKPAE